MNYSSHKNLQKPLSTEKYNVAVFNTNADIIDSELHKLDLKNESQDNLLATKESVNDHTANKSNPHEVTKSQVGLSNVDNKSSAAIRSEITKENVTNALGYTPYTPNEVDNMISDKVDKESGKGLSSNDYTTIEKNKLDSIEENAEVNQNTFSNIKVGNLTVSADSKTDTVELVAGDNITITPDVANDKIIIASTASLSSDGNVTPKDIGALPVTGGTITGRLKVLAKDTEADPRLDVQAERVDILKTDGGNSVAKLTEEQIDFNVPIEAHDISAKSLEDSLVYRYIKPYKNQMYIGENDNNGNFIGTGINTSTIRAGIGIFENGNIMSLLCGLLFDSYTALRLRSKNAELEFIYSKVALRRNDKPVLEVEDDRTKIRIEKKKEGEVGYVDIGQNETTYANTVHKFLDENEKPGTIDVGQIQKNGQLVHFKENINVGMGSIIISGKDSFPITIEITACTTSKMPSVGSIEESVYPPTAVYSYVMSHDGESTAKLSANTSALSSSYGTITASAAGVTITSKVNALLVSVTGNATIETL